MDKIELETPIENIPLIHKFVSPQTIKGPGYEATGYGLSIREYFAAAALSGIVRDKPYPSLAITRDYAVAAVRYADALIKALNANQGETK